MLEKATELGVERVVPVEAGRSERGLEQAAAKRMARWNRIVREASEQSRRAHLPEIAAPVNLAGALKIEAAHRYVLEEAEAPRVLPTLPALRQSGDLVAVLVGPEGGWTDREREQIASSNWRPVSLGSQILRAETAAIAALAIVHAAWWWIKPCATSPHSSLATQPPSSPYSPPTHRSLDVCPLE